MRARAITAGIATASILLTTACWAQQVLPVSLSRPPDVTRFLNNCVGVIVRVEAGLSSLRERRDWAATATYLYRTIASLSQFDHIEIDLRRGDEPSRSRDENGLAHLMATVTPRCGGSYDPLIFFVATRLLTAADFHLRTLYYAMSDAGFNDDEIRRVAQRKFKLKNGWMLPNIARTKSELVDPIDTRAGSADVARIIETIRAVR